MSDLSTADPIGVVYEFLRTHAAAETAAALGVPVEDVPSHVTGELEPSWPHVVLGVGPGGDLGDLTWNLEHEVEVTVYGSPAGFPGEADLWAIAVRVAQLVRSLPDRPTPPGEPVVVDVRPSGTLAWAVNPSGHPSWTLGLMVTLHPANG